MWRSCAFPSHSKTWNKPNHFYLKAYVMYRLICGTHVNHRIHIYWTCLYDLKCLQFSLLVVIFIISYCSSCTFYIWRVLLFLIMHMQMSLFFVDDFSPEFYLWLGFFFIQQSSKNNFSILEKWANKFNYFHKQQTLGIISTSEVPSVEFYSLELVYVEYKKIWKTSPLSLEGVYWSKEESERVYVRERERARINRIT